MGGYHLAFVIGALLVVAAIAVGVTVLQHVPMPAEAGASGPIEPDGPDEAQADYREAA